jgi:hypothetical protein
VRQPGRGCRPLNCWRQSTPGLSVPGDLAADIFESDEELEEFLAFTYAGSTAAPPDPAM